MVPAIVHQSFQSVYSCSCCANEVLSGSQIFQFEFNSIRLIYRKYLLWHRSSLWFSLVAVVKHSNSECWRLSCSVHGVGPYTWFEGRMTSLASVGIVWGQRALSLHPLAFSPGVIESSKMLFKAFSLVVRHLLPMRSGSTLSVNSWCWLGLSVKHLLWWRVGASMTPLWSWCLFWRAVFGGQWLCLHDAFL